MIVFTLNNYRVRYLHLNCFLFFFQASHGRPEDEVRHVGDIGNIYSTDSMGKTTVNVEDSIINMKEDGDLNSSLGRTIIIHQLPDFYNSSSIGPRIACGIIMKGKLYVNDEKLQYSRQHIALFIIHYYDFLFIRNAESCN